MNPHRIKGFRTWTREPDRRAHRLQRWPRLPFAIERGVTVTAELQDGDEVVAPELGDDDRFLRGRRRRAAPRGPRAARLQARARQRPASGRGARLVRGALRGAHSPSTAWRTPRRRGRERLARLCSRIESEWAGQETGLLDQLLAARRGGARPPARHADARGPVGRAGPARPRASHARLGCAGAWPSRATASGARMPASRGAARPRVAAGRRRRRRPPAPLNRRVRHVITENERVDAAVAALAAASSRGSASC